MVSPKGFFWFIHYLFCYVTAVFWTSTVSSSVLLRHYAFYSWFPTFHCFIICLLRHCCVLGLDCLFFCLLRDYAFSSWYPLSHYQLLRHYAISSRFPLFHYLFVTIVSSSVCYVTFQSLYSGYVCSASSSQLLLRGVPDAVAVGLGLRMCRSLTPKPHRQLRVRNLPKVPIYVAAKMGLKPTTFQTKGIKSTNEPPCPTIISLQDFHCFIVCLLRHCSVYGFDCLLC